MESMECLKDLYFIVDGSGNYYHINNIVYLAEDSNYQAENKVTEFIYDMEQIDWKEYLMHFSYVAAQTGRYLEELKKKQTEVDMQICDIMHLVELYDLDDEESLETMDLLRDCRERRRNIKDEIQLVECFQRSIGNSSNVAKAKDGIKQMEKLDGRRRFLMAGRMIGQNW